MNLHMFPSSYDSSPEGVLPLVTVERRHLEKVMQRDSDCLQRFSSQML